MNKKQYLLAYILIILLSCTSLFAQQKVDQILMTNGEVKSGHVVGLSDDAIEFVHDGESLKYTFKKINVSKIEFGSGRIEVFNEVKAGGKDEMLLDHHNKIAILPFTYLKDGEQKKNDAMERKAQREFYTLLQGHLGTLKAQDVNTTNAVLSKNGVNDDNFINFTIPELANMLGVEYIVQSTLSISEKGATTYGSSYGTLKAKDKNKLTATSFDASSTSLQFQTNLDMILYNDQGESVWTRTKESFWPNADAYLQTIKFLLKRMPIYQK